MAPEIDPQLGLAAWGIAGNAPLPSRSGFKVSGFEVKSLTGTGLQAHWAWGLIPLGIILIALKP